MPVEWLLLVTSLNAAPAAATTQAVAESPSVELLEFLGAWETARGQWIDPTQLEDGPTEHSAQEADPKAVERKHEQR